MKVDKPFIEAMRQATQLLRVRGPATATRLIQRLLRASGTYPIAAPTIDSEVVGLQPPRHRDAEILEPIPAQAPLEDEPLLPVESGTFLSKTFSSDVGSRSFKLYVPSCYTEAPLPLIIMLHGCTQDPDDFAMGTRANRWAEGRRCLVAYPEQIQRANSHRCWNWFRPGDQHGGRGEPAIIAGITSQIADEYRVDIRRIYVAGLSAGGAMAAILGHTYPDLYAAIGVHSGLPVGAANNVPSALALMKTGRSPLTHGLPRPTSKLSNAGRVVPLIVLHGDADRTVNPINAARLVEDALAARQTLARDQPSQPRVQTAVATEDSHGYHRTVYTDAGGIGVIEYWQLYGAGHAWAGGNRAGSFADARGPDATKAMLDFFDHHRAPGAGAPLSATN
ncbi:MAG: PHB depolymerase family esterase [Burkholderiaceae bacterium]